jgi:hypothetical protein
MVTNSERMPPGCPVASEGLCTLSPEGQGFRAGWRAQLKPCYAGIAPRSDHANRCSMSCRIIGLAATWSATCCCAVAQ